MYEAISILYVPFIPKAWILSVFFSQATSKAAVCYKPGVILKVIFNSKFQEVVETLQGQNHLSVYRRINHKQASASGHG